MMSLEHKLYQIGEALADISTRTPVTVYHYWRFSREIPYIIWQEDGEDGALTADNHKHEQEISGTVDLFTKKEFDPIMDYIQEALNGIENLSWGLNSVQYEDDTMLIHYEWRWRIL